MQQITFTEEARTAILKEVQEGIMGCPSIDTIQSFLKTVKLPTFTPPIDTVKPVIVFSADAWLKIQALVKNCPEEIGWHCVVEKLEGQSLYLISEVLVFPQMVSGSSVIPDQRAYTEWMTAHYPEPYFNNIRCHGHSHVNMGCFSSGVDDGYQDGILTQLKTDDYYIFTIHNKRDEMMVKLFDKAQNVLFIRDATHNDIDIRVFSNKVDINKWANEEIAGNLVKAYSAPYAGGYQKAYYEKEAEEYLGTPVKPRGADIPHIGPVDPPKGTTRKERRQAKFGKPLSEIKV